MEKYKDFKDFKDFRKTFDEKFLEHLSKRHVELFHIDFKPENLYLLMEVLKIYHDWLFMDSNKHENR